MRNISSRSSQEKKKLLKHNFKGEKVSLHNRKGVRKCCFLKRQTDKRDVDYTSNYICYITVTEGS